MADLYSFKNHLFGVRDDAEMQRLVELVKAAGVNQPALVRPLKSTPLSVKKTARAVRRGRFFGRSDGT